MQGAKFLVDLNAMAGSAQVEIAGAFDIPILRAYGQLSIILSSQKFEISGQMSFFDGLLSAQATIAWGWDFSYFKAELADMNFLNIVTVKQLLFELNSATSSARFAVRPHPVSCRGHEIPCRTSGPPGTPEGHKEA